MWCASKGAVRRILGAVIAALALAGCSAAPSTTAVRAAALRMLTGVYEPYSPGTYWQVARFASATGEQPSIVVYYSQWGQPFAAGFARQVTAHRGTVLVQVDPRGVSLAAIADGSQDAYLSRYAAAVRAFGHQVIISFGQEMNGNWYAWGTGRANPADYIAAWRHIVNMFRASHTTNVTWLWDVNCPFPGSSPVSEWWPGAAYVTWAGVDCYYAHPADTFTSLFGPVLAAVQQVTTKPVLIAETASGPDSGTQRETQIRSLFAGVKAYHLLGFVWFDEAQHDGPYHQDWRLEDDPAALAAFRAAVKELR